MFSVQKYAEELKKVGISADLFDSFRLVNPQTHQIYFLQDGKPVLSDLPPCYTIWHATAPCENCISIRTCLEQKEFVKFEHLDGHIWLIFSLPLFLENRVFSIELGVDVSSRLIISNQNGACSPQVSDLVKIINGYAVRDASTNLYNNQYIKNKLNVLINQNKFSSLSFLLMDINSFKQINDCYGHLVGDEVIKKISEVLQPFSERKGCQIGRMGGDEFSVIFENFTQEQARTLTKEIIDKVEQVTFNHEKNAFSISVSYGISDYRPEDTELTLINRADSLMYRMKGSLANKKILLYDDLTGVLTRRGFYLKILPLIQDNPDKNYVIIYGNIRGIKVINELYGTEVGDRIIQYTALSLQNSFLNPEASARMEADHFAFCVEEKYLDYNRLTGLASQSFHYHNTVYPYNIRFGIYRVTDRTMTANAMCDRAKAAKQSITDEYWTPYAIWDESMRDSIIDPQILQQDMDSSLTTDNFLVYYQPIVEIKTGKIVSAEALVRWQHPQKGLISPGIFIPLFEKNGSITRLDMYVGDKVCKFQKKRLNDHLPFVPVSVNCSRINFHRNNLVSSLCGLIQLYDIPASALRMEITESAYAMDQLKTIELLQKLRGFGLKILMDDFGSGMSSFNTLQRIPVDILKLDMKFLDEFKNNTKCREVIASIIGMAKRIKLEVVAEGVETEEEFLFLKKAGCDYIQGFYFYKPMPEEEFSELLTKELSETTKV